MLSDSRLHVTASLGCIMRARFIHHTRQADARTFDGARKFCMRDYNPHYRRRLYECTSYRHAWFTDWKIILVDKDGDLRFELRNLQ